MTDDDVRSMQETLRPLVEQGNPYASLMSAQLHFAPDEATAQKVADHWNDVIERAVTAVRGVVDGFNRAFGTDWLARLQAIIDQLPVETDDAGDYDDTPEGCWATSTTDDEEACDLPATDELGLCADHRARMVGAS